ncbi:Cystine/glutamate transporter [Holothuria leucospilota]|uniref:Cystine/glutamate transporter n=1 Tax=Holothuria leucospilota TaxID=206669 RepID=A0A9Q1CLZ6_HOLLE|nr:Cystine/glutamate transporter [Holothuria leucospilota]
MVISFVCVTILYLLTNVAYFAVLTPEEIISSDAVAALFAVRVIGVKWSSIIWLCVVLSAAGNLNGATYTKSRVFFVAARDRQFPFILSTIHVRRKTPLAAIIVSAPITVLVIYSGNIWTVINFLYCFAQVQNILTMAIVPYLRWKKPERVLSYKAPLWSCVVYMAFTIVVLLMTAYSHPIQIGITVAIIFIALAHYLLNQLIDKSDRFQAKLSKFPLHNCNFSLA